MLPVVCASAQIKQPITHESLWLLKRVGTPALSPDGKWVVCSVQEPAYDEKDVVNDLWLVPADGSKPPRRITGNRQSESGYSWSPDSKQLAFIAKRDNDSAAQVYVLNLAEGGEAQRLTNISTGASNPKWSPDGNNMLFSSNVYPGANTDSANKKVAADLKKQKYKARVYTGFPVRYWDHWLDEKRTHWFIQPVAQAADGTDLFAALDSITQTAIQFGENPDANWLPDSKSVIFSATDNAGTAAWRDVTLALYIASVDGKPGIIIGDSSHSYNNPVISEDGKYLYCIENAENNYKVYNIGKLVRYNWPSLKNKTYLCKNIDRPINDFELSGQGVVISFENEGRDKLYFISNGSTEAKQISAEATGCYTSPSISGDGSVIVANFQTASQPPEIVLIQSNQQAHKALTSFNTEALTKLDLGTTEDFWITSSKGKKIHSLIIKPAGFDAAKKYPLFVVMHGGPAGEWKYNWGYRWNYHLLAAPGYVLLLTNYTGSTGFGEKFSQDIQFDPFKGPANEIQEAATAAIKQFAFIDGSKQAAGGASYGGHLANWMEATTSHYKCIICHAGLVNSEAQWGTSDGIYSREVMNGGTPWQLTKTFKEQNPIRFAANFRTPILVTVGEQDFRVPLNNSLENWSALQRMKVPSKLIVFPEENHWISKAENSRFFYQQVHEWLAKYLQ